MLIKKRHTGDMENETPYFGIVLKELRLKKKLSQEKLAESAGIERNYIYYLEKGRSEPTLRVLKGLAKGFGMSSLPKLKSILRVPTKVSKRVKPFYSDCISVYIFM